MVPNENFLMENSQTENSPVENFPLENPPCLNFTAENPPSGFNSLGNKIILEI